MSKIRVLHIVGYMNRGGQETLLMNILREINKAEFDFSFVVQTKEKCDYDDEIKALGGCIYRLPAVYRNPISRFFKLRKIVNDRQYHVVHRHSDKSIEWIDLLAAKFGGASVRIYHSHNKNVRILLYKWLHFLFRPVNNRLATHKFACSNEAGRWMFGKKPFNAGEVIIIPNAIDMNKFKFDFETRKLVRSILNIENKFAVGHIGRFDYQKNHKFLIDVFSQLNKKRSDTILILVGVGELMPKIKCQVSELGLDNLVYFLNIRSDVHELYQAMDVFVLPSLYEGLPVVAVEAQAAGLPLICSDRVTNEVALSPTVSFLPLGNTDIWVEAILCKKCPNERTKNYYILKASKYDIKTMTDLIVNQYINAFKNRGQTQQFD